MNPEPFAPGTRVRVVRRVPSGEAEYPPRGAEGVVLDDPASKFVRVEVDGHPYESPLGFAGWPYTPSELAVVSSRVREETRARALEAAR